MWTFAKAELAATDTLAHFHVEASPTTMHQASPKGVLDEAVKCTSLIKFQYFLVFSVTKWEVTCEVLQMDPEM